MSKLNLNNAYQTVFYEKMLNAAFIAIDSTFGSTYLYNKRRDLTGDNFAEEFEWYWDDSVGCFHLPIEDLMLEVITLLGLAKRRDSAYPAFVLEHHQKIQEILQENDLQEMLSVLTDEEDRKMFENHLRILGY